MPKIMVSRHLESGAFVHLLSKKSIQWSQKSHRAYEAQSLGLKAGRLRDQPQIDHSLLAPERIKAKVKCTALLGVSGVCWMSLGVLSNNTASIGANRGLDFEAVIRHEP
jgi:hypothetical protein